MQDTLFALVQARIIQTTLNRDLNLFRVGADISACRPAVSARCTAIFRWLTIPFRAAAGFRRILTRAKIAKQIIDAFCGGRFFGSRFIRCGFVRSSSLLCCLFIRRGFLCGGLFVSRSFFGSGFLRGFGLSLLSRLGFRFLLRLRRCFRRLGLRSLLRLRRRLRRLGLRFLLRVRRRFRRLGFRFFFASAAAF